MKKLVCELCGSQHMINDGDYYVCESCGTKFTAEQAKKLMVDVNVTIDNSANTEKLYAVARRAFDNGDYASAESNYKAILNEVPEDWEAYFLSVYCNAMQCKIGEIASAANQIRACLADTCKMIAALDGESEKKAALDTVTSCCMNAANNLVTSGFNHFQKFMNVSGSRKEFEQKCDAVGRMIAVCCTSIGLTFPYKESAALNKCYVEPAKLALKLANIYSGFGFLNMEARDNLVVMIKPHDMEYAEKYFQKKKNGEKVALVVYLLFLVGGTALAISGLGDLFSFSFMFGTFLGVVGLIASISSIVKMVKGKKK